MDQQKTKLIEHLRELRNIESLRTCGTEAAERYRNNHTYRFDRTINICKKLVPDIKTRVLDIGVSQLTILLKQYYGNVTTLGYPIAEDGGGQRTKEVMTLSSSHIIYDLNNAEHFENWPDIKEKFDLIVFAETVEHLKIAPEYALTFLRLMLTEKGIILVTTPNAVTIMKRLILLLKGKNPYERIRMFSENPGHYREYTMREMMDIGKRSGLEVVHEEFVNMYKAASVTQSFLKRLHPSFRDTIVVAYQRRKDMHPSD
jgi:2-polyprenyl-3-methyl-5-hydroxy-6-metoxy-1,4-benzoquinol methylase